MLLWTAVLAFAVAALLTRSFAHPGSRLHILDHPNERSLHSCPTPRAGGVAIVIGIFGGLALSVLLRIGAQDKVLWLGALAVGIALVSYLDDRQHVPVLYRLSAHLAAGGLLVLGGLDIRSVPFPGFGDNMTGWFAATAAVLFVVWMTNLYNFMDGMDGFAGGMAVFGFATFALLGWLSGSEAFFTINTIIAAASAGFLIFNFPPAKIFMGDTGSSTLGFLAAGIALWADRDGIFPLWVSVLVFSPFIVDATVTLLRRMLRGERVWKAHKTHYYQRLVQLGWGHRRTVLAEYALMAACAASALWMVNKSPSIQYMAIGVWAVIYMVLTVGVIALERKTLRRVR